MFQTLLRCTTLCASTDLVQERDQRIVTTLRRWGSEGASSLRSLLTSHSKSQTEKWDDSAEVTSSFQCPITVDGEVKHQIAGSQTVLV